MKNLEIEANKANEHFEERLLPKGEGKSETVEAPESGSQESAKDSECSKHSEKEPEAEPEEIANDESIKESSSDEDEAEITEGGIEEPKKDK